MSEDKHIEIRSDEVQEILGTPPRWIVRWGITIMLLVVLILFAGSYLFKYPDEISSRVIILSENPPVPIVARADGQIDQLFVSNDQRVAEGELLAVIENTADFRDAYRLMGKLDSIRSLFRFPEKFSATSFKEDYRLGQYHAYFSAFVTQLRNYQTFLAHNPYDQRVKNFYSQLEGYQQYLKKLADQTEVLRQDNRLALNQFERDSSLYRRQLLSEEAYEQSRAAMLKQKLALQHSETETVNTQMTMNDIRQQVKEQEVLMAELESHMLAALKEKFDNLVNELAGWEQAYILKTPISGQVTFNRFWSENQFATAGEVIFNVVPREEQRVIGRALVPVRGAGKVEPGQRVNIKLDNYPHMEYGIVEGEVSTISKVPADTGKGAFYTVQIVLVNHLKTNYGKTLPFNQEMQGTAEIITKDRRLIQRLFDPVVSAARENF